MHLPFYQEIIESELGKLNLPESPTGLYEPIRYMISLGGKRIRPALALMACEAFGKNHSHALKTAIGIELFHNFTLMHDDIMDKAPIRRSLPTVHTKWNTDVAILSGDALFVKSCQLIYESGIQHNKELMSAFLQTAMAVCEGQQWDMQYQAEAIISEQQYFTMIENKTAVLLACALKLGAVIGGADEKNADLLYDFGIKIGLAFQLQDDLLDAYPPNSEFGKKTGGDILINKKTFLLVKAYELADKKTKTALQFAMGSSQQSEDSKIQTVLSIFDTLRIKELANLEIQKQFDAAQASIRKINFTGFEPKDLIHFSELLMTRKK